MDSFKYHPIQAPPAPTHDLEPVEAEVGQQAGAQGPVESPAQVWSAHESDATSQAMQQSLHGVAPMPRDPMTMDEFYHSCPHEQDMRQMDAAMQHAHEAMAMAQSQLQMAHAQTQMAHATLQMTEAGQKLQTSISHLAGALAQSPANHEALTGLANAADKLFLDFASGGDALKRASMAGMYGSSVGGAGAFGNAIAQSLGQEWAAAAGFFKNMSTALHDAAQAPPPQPRVISDPIPHAPTTQAPPPGPAVQAPPAPTGPVPHAPPPPTAHAAGHHPAHKPAHKKPEGYDLLDKAREPGHALHEGAHGKEVKALQRSLNQAGAHPKLPVNGKFDGKTHAAVEVFQAWHGCKVDGVVGPKTMHAMDKALHVTGGHHPAHHPAHPTHGSHPTHPTGGPSGGGSGAHGNAAVRIAETQIGVHEATGNNDGVPAQRYSSGQKEPWCANFVSWLYRRAGDPLPGNQDAIGNCNTMASELASKGEVYRPGARHPEPGDIVFFGSYPGGLHHTGIVESVSKDGRTVNTIEGNCGDRVARQTHSVSSLGALARPS